MLDTKTIDREVATLLNVIERLNQKILSGYEAVRKAETLGLDVSDWRRQLQDLENQLEGAFREIARYKERK